MLMSITMALNKRAKLGVSAFEFFQECFGRGGDGVLLETDIYIPSQF